MLAQAVFTMNKCQCVLERNKVHLLFFIFCYALILLFFHILFKPPLFPLLLPFEFCTAAPLYPNVGKKKGRLKVNQHMIPIV